MKTKALLSSILVIALCLSLIAGSTFALFTSETEANIAVTAGKVNVVAGLDITKVESVKYNADGTITDENGKTYSYDYADAEAPYTFINGGTAAVEGAVLTLDKVTPGDKVTFNITGTNNSNVKTQYRYIIECTEGYMLMSGLTVTVAGAEYKSIASYTSAWATLDADEDFAASVTVELPVTAGNEYQGETTAIKVTVEAVQGNAVTEGDVAVEYINQYVVRNDEELAAALAKNEKNLVICLAADVAYTINDYNFPIAMGGEDTEIITIDGNGHTLTFKGESPNDNGVATNNDAKLIINNAKVAATATSSSTVWNVHDVLFACDVELNNVTLDQPIAVKADATLNNVTVTDANDVYALWIAAEGQTVTIDGLTVNAGRGIKIDDQYVNAPAKVTLNVSNAEFNTLNKGAIMVKTTAGADIKLDNVDITNVFADSTNAVWVDKDPSTGDVTVIGGTKISENDFVTNSTELDAAIKAGKTEILMAGGTYNMPASAKGKTLTLTGLGATVIEVVPAGRGEAGGQLDYNLDGSTVTFNNLTIKTNNKTYAGYARLSATYNNCTIENQYCLNGDSEFNNCTFNVSGNVYNVWTWGATNVTFDGCTFNSDGKAVLLYGQANTNLIVKNCVFNDNGGLTDKKAAIEIGNDYNKSYTLTVTNTTVNGYEINDTGINTGSTLWANKNSMDTDKLNVVVDGVEVY